MTMKLSKGVIQAIVVCVSIICATVLLVLGKGGWGWFIGLAFVVLL